MTSLRLLQYLPSSSSPLHSYPSIIPPSCLLALPPSRNPNHVFSLSSKPLSHIPMVSIAAGSAEHFYLERQTEAEDLGPEGEVFRRTLRLVECAMLASVAGLTYILSNSLAIENYFGCFFSLPIVMSSMRWGLAAGRKTMVATAMLLLTLSGPVKATTYLLMHGFVGLAMGSLWRLRANWGLSILLCSFIRAFGAVGYVLLSSFLIRENILNLITINIHATLMGVLAAVGVNTMLTMNTVYTIFTVLLVINCGCFVFLLHILYSVFFTKLGMKDLLNLPKWLKRAL